MSKTVTPLSNLEELVEIYRTDPIRSLVSTIDQGALDGAEAFEGFLKEINSEDVISNMTAVYADYLCLYTHLMNRALSDELNIQESIDASRVLTREIIVIAAETMHKLNPSLDVPQLLQMIPARINAMEEKYSGAISFVGDSYNDKTSIVHMFRERMFEYFDIKGDPMKRIQIEMCLNYSTFLMLVEFSEWVKGSIAQLGYRQYGSINLVNNDRIERISQTMKEHSKNSKRKG